MPRVFITGSSDGLGLLAGQFLAKAGHAVTLHARSEARAADTRAAMPQAEHIIIGDLASIAGMRSIAAQANALGRYDAVIHNAGVGYREPRAETADGLEHIFAINTLAPYVLPMRSGSAAHGTAFRRISTANCMTRCSRSPSRAAGRTCVRTRSNPAG
jgi:NAD(P)-dependent dehydrogenase (short-subunit alcohol dehydrogenase family)